MKDIKVTTREDGARVIVVKDIPGFKGYTSKFPACFICQRWTAADHTQSAGVLLGGGASELIHPDDIAIDMKTGGYMGFEPVGASCVKKIPAEFVVTYDDPRLAR